MNGRNLENTGLLRKLLLGAILLFELMLVCSEAKRAFLSPLESPSSYSCARPPCFASFHCTALGCQPDGGLRHYGAKALAHDFERREAENHGRATKKHPAARNHDRGEPSPGPLASETDAPQAPRRAPPHPQLSGPGADSLHATGTRHGSLPVFNRVSMMARV